jgi:hypothetical protein
MAFSASELWSIKRELGYNLLNTGATAYVGVSQLIEQVVNNNIEAEVSTTATIATAIAASSQAAPQTLTLASPTGFATGQRCYIDVDARQEVATLQYLSSTSATFLLSLPHSGTIPIVVEGPISICKGILRKIEAVRSEMASTYGEGAIKAVDEVEFYDQGGATMFGSLGSQLRFWRNELSAALAVPNLWERTGGGSVAYSVY